MTFKRNILRNIFGLVLKDNKCRIRTNVELEKLYKDVNIGTVIKLQHLRQMGHHQWKDNARTTEKIHQANIHQKLPKLRPKARWKDDVQNDVRKMRIVNWRQVAKDRDE
jgi:hypothetical protein